jgi:hypothetical protein
MSGSAWFLAYGEKTCASAVTVCAPPKAVHQKATDPPLPNGVVVASGNQEERSGKSLCLRYLSARRGGRQSGILTQRQGN